MSGDVIARAGEVTTRRCHATTVEGAGAIVACDATIVSVDDAIVRRHATTHAGGRTIVSCDVTAMACDGVDVGGNRRDVPCEVLDVTSRGGAVARHVRGVISQDRDVASHRRLVIWHRRIGAWRLDTGACVVTTLVRHADLVV